MFEKNLEKMKAKKIAVYRDYTVEIKSNESLKKLLTLCLIGVKMKEIAQTEQEKRKNASIGRMLIPPKRTVSKAPKIVMSQRFTERLERQKLVREERKRKQEMLFREYPFLKTASDLFRELLKEQSVKQAEIEKAKAVGEAEGGVVKTLEEDLRKWEAQKIEEIRIAVREKLEEES